MCARCRCNHKLNKCPKDVYVKFVISPLVSLNISYDNNVTPLPEQNAEIICSYYVLAAYDKICNIGKILENDRKY